jgi:dipeptidyl aminopeptidase/acylaminoacyl peptidase
MPRRPLALADLEELRAISDPQISPDGRRVAFVVETIDPVPNETRSRIWLIDAEEGVVPRPLTTGERQDTQPRWSPDGRVLAFASTRRGTRQIWLLPADGGEATPLTDHPTGARDPAWSPDGAYVVYVAKGPDHRDEPPEEEDGDDRRRLVWVREHRHKLDGQGFFDRGRDHLWIVAVADGTATQLTDGPYDDADPAWSPDGRMIAFASDRSPNRDHRFGGTAIHLVEARTGAVRRLTPEEGRAAHPSWSPDGAWIAYPGSNLPDDSGPANTRLWIARADGSESRCLTADLDRSVGQRPGGYLTPSPPAWIPDVRALLYLVGDGPSTHLTRVADGERAALTSGRRVVLTFSADRSARRAGLLVTDATTPPEVWLWDEATGARPLTGLNRPLLGEVTLAAPEDLRITRPDGTVVEGWLLRPTTPTEPPYPLILSVHGGPHNYFGDAFSFDQQLFAARGYAVLYLNPRGSGGYGEDFARAVLQDWGGEDFQDLLAFLDYALARNDPPIDPVRLAITGGSYGGFMTCWAVTQTDRFKVAVSGACIANLVSFFGTSDIGASWGEREFGGTPFDRAEWYLSHSPLTHAPRVQTPLLLYHGEADLRCPIEQSEQMFSALHRFGKTVELLRVPTENHGVLSGTPAHRLSVRQAILDWFEKYL